MASFGNTLRAFREMTRDPERHKRPLSQAHLGILMGHLMGDRGFSGASVSNWERGENSIRAEDRKVLITLIRVLYEYCGVKNPEDANQLLDSGYYRPLNKEETQEVFGETTADRKAEQAVPDPESSRFFSSFLRGKRFTVWDTELSSLLADVEKGPSPSWPRLLAALMGKTSERVFLSPKTVLWIGIWWLAWWLIAPSLRWPFESRTAVLQAVSMYIVGTLVVPLLAGALIDTKHNDYWKKLGLFDSRLLRLYTYQGAGIGFNLGYFFVLPLVLIRHYFDLGPSSWPAVIAATLGLILANMGARVVPHNLWLAYHRLHFRDGAIFFVVAWIGPLWGLFFLEYYSILLTPLLGVIVILAALLLFILIPVGRSRKKTDTERAQP